ncbi:unnamed protein product [Ectocarpus sp. 12 AP-2014]
MGAYLSQPNLAKDTQDGDDGELRWGAAGMQGWRTGMEDSHLACLDLNGKDSATPAADPAKKIAAFAVFDGHGGAEVAKYCSAHICDVVKGTEAFKEGNLGLGLKQTFLKMDDMLRTPAGQAELLALKKASQGEDSDSDDGEDEVVDMDMLSKINPETQMQIMEQMKRAMRDQFQSAGDLAEGGGGGDDDSSEHDDDSKYSSEEEEEEEGGGDNGEESKTGEGAAGSPAATAAAEAPATKAAPAGECNAEDKPEEKEDGGAAEGEAAAAAGPWPKPPAAKGGEGARGDAEEANSTAEEWADGSSAGLEPGARRRCGFDCGATAVMGLLVGGKTLVVANAGDSRCVVSRNGVAVDMSTDHKPEDDIELNRIEKAGGAVVDGRVQGNLNLSRAIGDLMYKADEALSPEEQMITADPELKTLELTPQDEFIVLACDGVWNSLSSQETIDFVRTRLKDSGDEPLLSKACADLCDACCAETTDGDGTGLDNVTAVIVRLNTEGARALTGASAAAAAAVGDMDTSDDGKRKQGDGGREGEEDEDEGRSKKQMKAVEAKAAEENAAAAEGEGDK